MKIGSDQTVEFDEFSRTCDLVEDYFGDTIDDVALHAPVSRRQLIAVLARAQLFGRQFSIAELTAQGEVAYQSNDETLCWLDGGFWTNMRGLHHLEPDERRAAREVHRRLIEAIDGDVPYYNRERDPFVRIERRFATH